MSADLQGDTALAQKQKAMALLEYMRTKGRIPEAGTSRKREPDARAPPQQEESKQENESQPKEKTHEVTSAPAFNNCRLTQEEENEVYIELAEFLNDKSFSLLAQ